MKFFCCYTQTYSHWKDRCVNSFSPWINVIPILMDDRQDWMSNCRHRSQILLEHLLQSQQPVMMLDADLKCLKYPQKLIDLPPYWDVIGHDRGPLSHINRRYCAGIIGFNYTDLGKQTLSNWTFRNNRNQYQFMKLSEQVYLHESITNIKPNFSNLGNLYNYVCPFGEPIIPQDIIILHGTEDGPAHRYKTADQM
jgi:hypothetical protein